MDNNCTEQGNYRFKKCKLQALDELVPVKQ
jgi:hypothetical protein